MEHTAVYYSLVYFIEGSVSIWEPKYGSEMGEELWEWALDSREAADVLS